MSKYSEWTDEQVNEATFGAKGWSKIKSIYDGSELWIKQESDDSVWCDCLHSVPDYTHDWRLCGELLEEMLVLDVTLLAVADEKTWIINWLGEQFCDLHEIETNSPKRSICEGWLEWNEVNYESFVGDSDHEHDDRIL